MGKPPPQLCARLGWYVEAGGTHHTGLAPALAQTCHAASATALAWPVQDLAYSIRASMQLPTPKLPAQVHISPSPHAQPHSSADPYTYHYSKVRAFSFLGPSQNGLHVTFKRTLYGRKYGTLLQICSGTNKTLMGKVSHDLQRLQCRKPEGQPNRGFFANCSIFFYIYVWPICPDKYLTTELPTINTNVSRLHLLQ